MELVWTQSTVWSFLALQSGRIPLSRISLPQDALRPSWRTSWMVLWCPERPILVIIIICGPCHHILALYLSRAFGWDEIYFLDSLPSITWMVLSTIFYTLSLSFHFLRQEVDQLVTAMISLSIPDFAYFGWLYSALAPSSCMHSRSRTLYLCE